MKWDNIKNKRRKKESTQEFILVHIILILLQSQQNCWFH